MLGLANTPNGKAPVELRELPEPQPARNEALVAVRAFSLNRGELRSLVNNEEGWVPGQDWMSLTYCRPAATLHPPRRGNKQTVEVRHVSGQSPAVRSANASRSPL
jgi:hypothetical protein